MRVKESYSELEGSYFPYAHEVVGAAVLDKWNFNRSLVMTTLHHDDLKIRSKKRPAMAAVNSIA